jgi:hypothetical protein
VRWHSVFRIEVLVASTNIHDATSVSSELDLVEVASQIIEDFKEQVEQWLVTGRVGKVADEQTLARNQH